VWFDLDQELPEPIERQHTAFVSELSLDDAHGEAANAQIANDFPISTARA
jgi:hypothetical protein